MTHSIDIKQLTYRWPQQPTLIDIPELTVKQGEAVLIRGESGSGKSTLLNLLAGVLSPTTGHIQLLGQPFSGYSGRQRDLFRADYIGYIFQQFNLLPYLSTVQNVILPSQISSIRKQNVLRHFKSPEAAAHHWLSKFNLDKSLLSKPAAQLSIGQQQRVAAARALIGTPRIILADEPTSALDQVNAHTFMQALLQEVHAINSTLIFVSHDSSLASHFDRCIELPTVSLEKSA